MPAPATIARKALFLVSTLTFRFLFGWNVSLGGTNLLLLWLFFGLFL